MPTIAESQGDNYAVSVGTSATEIVTEDPQHGSAGLERHVIVVNNHASQILYVGFGSDVAVGTGLPVAAGASWSASLHSRDNVYAIASGAATDVRVSVLHGKGDPA